MDAVKKKMAFVDLCNFQDWPMGGMLEYERTILKHLVNIYDVDLWGVSVDGKNVKSISINGNTYDIKIYGNVKTKKKIIPNYLRGLAIVGISKKEFRDYDIAYIHTGSCAVGLLNKIDRKKTVVAYHQHGLSYLTTHALMVMIQKPFYYLSQKTSDVVFVVSDEDSVNEYALKMKNKTKAEFIPVGSPIEIDHNIWESAFKRAKKAKKMGGTFIYTGRLDSHKDVKTVLEAFSCYLKEFSSKAKLVIVGDGIEESSLEEKSLEWGIADNVVFTGFVPHDEIFPYLMESDVYLTASYGEGMSVSVLEAYMCGLPVICFKVPGLEKQVIDRRTGLVVDGHSAMGMYKAMVEINNIWGELSLGCLEEVKKYDAEKITRYISGAIERVAEKD